MRPTSAVSSDRLRPDRSLGSEIVDSGLSVIAAVVGTTCSGGRNGSGSGTSTRMTPRCVTMAAFDFGNCSC